MADSAQKVSRSSDSSRASASIANSSIGAHPQIIEAPIFRYPFLNNYVIENSQDVLSLGFYFSTGNVEFRNDFFSKLILALKATEPDLRARHPEWKDWQIAKAMEQKRNVIAWFGNIIGGLFTTTKELIFIAVPSSKKNNPEHGPTMLANQVASNSTHFFCRNRCLIRTASRTAAHDGGDRSEAVQRETLAVGHEELLQDKTIVLIDDIITTGNSMDAAKTLLLEAGAQRIICLTIGKTVSDLTNFSGPFMACMIALNEIIRGMHIPSISMYNSSTHHLDSLPVSMVVETNLRLFHEWQSHSSPSREIRRPEVLHSFTAAASRMVDKSPDVSSDANSDIDDDNLLREILDEAPEVDARRIQLAKNRDLDLQEVFNQLGHDDGEISSDQQLFAANMREFGYDFLNIGDDDEPESDKEKIKVSSRASAGPSHK